MKIYLAAPLFTEPERAANADLCVELEEAGHQVFLPQRDGLLLSEQPESAREIFQADVAEVSAAGCLVAVLDGAVPDEGVLVEIGVAIGKGVPIVGYTTDSRAGKRFENPLWNQALKGQASNVDELLALIERLEW